MAWSAWVSGSCPMARRSGCGSWAPSPASISCTAHSAPWRRPISSTSSPTPRSPPLAWSFPAVIGAFLTAVYVLRVTKQIFWGPKPPDPHFQHLPDAQGPEWVALVLLTATLVLFGVAPGIAIGPVDTATVPLLLRLGGAP